MRPPPPAPRPARQTSGTAKQPGLLTQYRDALRAQGPTEIGTTLTFTTRGKERASQIAALDPGRSITLRSVQGGVTADYVYRCTPNGDGTRVSLVADCRMTGPVRLLSPMIKSAIRRADSGQLDAFAATLTQ